MFLETHMHDRFVKAATKITIIDGAPSAASTSVHGACLTIIKNSIFSSTPLDIDVKQTPICLKLYSSSF